LKLSTIAVQFLLAGLVAAPLVAQTQIGGGACNSSYLNGTYALSISARQVDASGTFLSVFEAIGSATFDGLSTVTIEGNENTNQAVGTTLNWSGTYSVQANCVAVLIITSGGNATLNVMLNNQGKNFLLTGFDSTYSYSGSGVAPPPNQSATCSVTTLNGVYTFNATGFTLSGTSVSGVTNGAGLLLFDGQGNLTVNVSTATGVATTTVSTLTGTYTISSNCTGSATVTDSNSNSFVIALSIYNPTAANTNFFASLARAATFLMSGGGHTVSSQSTACNTSTLNGTYSLSLSGRGISGTGNFTGSFQGIGTATFDGNGNVILAGTANTNLAQGNAFSYTGTYTLPSNCSGTLTVTTTGAASFALVGWNNGGQFAMVGSDASYVYSGSGGDPRPPACATAILSGEYVFTASGFTLSGTTQNGAQDEAGVMQFDGQGNVTAKYTDTQSGTTPVSDTAKGTYAVTSDCLASATLGDSSSKSNALNFVIAGPHGENLNLLAANSQFVRTGSAHSAFTNPGQAIGNVASYAYSATPPGSVFVLFGQNLAARPAGAVTTKLPTKLLDTTVTINGELAPLFYADPMQIDAQMPWDIPGNSVASVIVTNGSSVSNAAAVYVPATGTPGISTFANNRAAVVNADGNVNSPADQASVGDEVVAYFTGGGPVLSQINLIAGSPAGGGLSPVEGDNSVTVGGVQAIVVYMGLTPFGIGLYQANFIVPQVAKGVYPVVITIAGQISNNPVINVSN
jgi:uncharacterized protein (TIGR03437 family)